MMAHHTGTCLTRRCGMVLSVLVLGCGDSTGTDTTTFLPGEVYFGTQQYIEYQAGDLPIILVAPHGGGLTPASIPDRTSGVTTRDRNTQEVARAFAATLFDRTGHRPHIVINRLHRIKLDANREIGEAAQGNAAAETAWREFHEFIEAAKDAVVDGFGRGLYIDLHGHGHDIQRLELGYLLSAADLERSDALLDDANLVEKSSIRALVGQASAGFVELVRGAASMGGLLEPLGYPTVPSPTQPDPGGEPYFMGGYNTARHGSRDGGTISAMQIEMYFVGARDTEASRAAFAAALAEALEVYMATHFQVDLISPRPAILLFR